MDALKFAFQILIAGFIFQSAGIKSSFAEVKPRFQMPIKCPRLLKSGSAKAIKIANAIESAALSAMQSGQRFTLQTAAYQLPEEAFFETAYYLGEFLNKAEGFVTRLGDNPVGVKDIIVGREAIDLFARSMWARPVHAAQAWLWNQ